MYPSFRKLGPGKSNGSERKRTLELPILRHTRRELTGGLPELFP